MTDSKEKKPRKAWVSVLRWCAIMAVGVVAIILIAIGVAVWVLTPDRLTPLVGEFAGRYLNAEVKADRVELTYWSTFPTVSVDVRGLTVVSHSLDSLPEPEGLPEWADTLATVRRFQGGINLWALAVGKIALTDVTVDHPCLNLVKVDSVHANYDIVPPSEADSVESALPEISISRFAITGGAPVRYVSLADSIDATVSLLSTTLAGAEAPVYRIDVDGGRSGLSMPELVVPVDSFMADGTVRWDQRAPGRLMLSDFTVGVSGVDLTFNADLDFSGPLKVAAMTMTGKGLKINDVLGLVPEKYLPADAKISTDVVTDVDVALLSPYVLADSVTIPEVKVTLKAAGAMNYGRLALRRINADLDATVKGSDLDGSVLTVRDLTVEGRSIAFSLRGVVTHPLSDPFVDGHFNGTFNFAALPQQLLDRLPFTASGRLTGDAGVRLRMSDLTPSRFHRVYADGQVQLGGFTFAMRDSSKTAYARLARLNFGTDGRFVTDSVSVDSLLQLGVSADTISFEGEGVRFIGSSLKLNAAARNSSMLLDTSVVTPIGFGIKAGLIALRSDTDSMTVRLRDASVTATLQRYNDNARSPLLTMKVGARSLRYSDLVSRLSLTRPEVSLNLHPRSIRRVAAQRADTAALRRRVRSLDSIAAASGRENVDFDLDRNLMSWLRRWQASGTMKASRGRLLTPYFPVRNMLRNVDVSFSTDSLVIRDMLYRMGKSDFLINGTISNIARALTSRRGSPLDVNFSVESDTIDVNQITSAMIAGSAFAQKMLGGDAHIADGDDDESIQASINDAAPDSVRAAFIVPSNIRANLDVKAANVLYADIWFQRLTGKVAVADGAIHLDRLGGYTPMGSMDLTALYSAPTVDDLRFAAGIVVRQLHLKHFLQMLPEIDSVLPLLREVDGIITADAAMTTELDSMMNLKFNTFNLVLKLSGDSLTLVDGKTFRTMAKWLMFKHKHRNVIDSMQVELMVHDSKLDLFPFVFDIDRYRLGVSGSNSLDMDLDYHVAVLKSPLPFKFGINIKGHPGDLKIRLGKARFNENAVASRRELTDTARINLLGEIEKVFKFGVRSGRHTKLMLQAPKVNREEFSVADTLTHADSLIFIQGGAIEGPAVPPFPQGDNPPAKNKKEKKKSRK